MLISYPFLPDRAPETTDEEYEQSILSMEILNVGVYPSSHEQSWHGGIHIRAPSAIEPVRAVADGTLVAYRLNSALTKERPEDAAGKLDNSFVLIRHETEVDAVVTESGTLNPTKVCFYSLYMHLMNTADMVARGVDRRHIHASIQDSGQEVKKGNGEKIHRKDIIGFAGESYSTGGVIHFEIFTSDSDFKAFFVDSRDSSQIGKKGTWGDSYFVVKAGSSALASHPHGTTIGGTRDAHGNPVNAHVLPTGVAGSVDESKDLYVRIAYKKGTKYTTVWSQSEPDHPPTWLTPDDGVADVSYEYFLFEIATTLYPSCPSAGMELLRFGKLIGTDAPKLAAHEKHNWQLVTYAEGKQGYIDLADPSVVKQVLSDADFPEFLGWLSQFNGMFSHWGTCDISDLLDVLKAPQPDNTDKARKELKDYFNDPENRHLRDWVKRLIIQAPSEWDKANNQRCDQLKQKNGLGWGTDGPFYGNDEEFDKHMTFAESLQWWGDAGLGDSNVWHFHPFAFVEHFRKAFWLSQSDLKEAFPPTAMRKSNGHWVSETVNVSRQGLTNFLLPLNVTMRKFGISSPQRASAFLGNAMQETRWFQTVDEGGNVQKYAPWTGRGLLQLTWPGNYVKYNKFRGRTVSDSIASELHIAQNTADTSHSNAALIQVEHHLPADLSEWRILVATLDAADSAGAYWAWTKAAVYADEQPIMKRESNPVGSGVKVYYSCLSFGLVAAIVNTGSPNRNFGGVNGLVARYQAYTSNVVKFMDRLPFPRTVTSFSDKPEI